jgi:hypothetical protein
MTAPPSWSSDDPEMTARLGVPPGQPEMTARLGARARDGEPVAFRSLLGIAQFTQGAPYAAPGAGMHVNPSAISQQFTVGPASVTVETAGGTAEQVAEKVRKRLQRRAYTVGPTSPAQVGGYPGLWRVIQAKKRRRRPAGPPMAQMYTVVGPYSLMLTANQADAGFLATLGQVGLYPAAPPVITPVVRIPGADRYAVQEQVTITRDWVKLTGIVSRGQVTQSTDEFAMAKLAELRSRLVDMAVDNWQPDVFLDGRPCIRDTFLHGGAGRSSSMVRSEFWWAGVVGGRGIQLFVTATRSIISLDEARPLRDVVALLPPD